MSRNKPPKIVVSGYYGFGNCGDEAVLLAVTKCLKKLRPDARVVVLSANPEETRRSFGVGARNRWNPLAMALEMLSCNLFISGGGSLLQDVTGSGSVKYYLGVIKMALFLGRKVMFYCQGVGPLDEGRSRAKVARALNRCDLLTVRDEASAQLLRDIGVRREVHALSDAVMALCPDDADFSYIRTELGAIGLHSGESGCEPVSGPGKVKPLLLASFRNWKDDRHAAPVAELLDTQIERGWDVLLIPAFFPADCQVMDQIVSAMKYRPHRLDINLTARQFIALAAHADKVFSMRLHGLVCAMAMGTPVFALSYDPKVEAFMEQAGLGRYCLKFEEVEGAAGPELLEELDSLPARRRQAIEARRAEMQKQAWEAARMAVGLLQ